MDEQLTKTTKLVCEGNLIAEVEVTLIESDHPWAPYLSLEDVEKLDKVRLALRAKDIARASKIAKLYELRPVTVE